MASYIILSCASSNGSTVVGLRGGVIEVSINWSPFRRVCCSWPGC